MAGIAMITIEASIVAIVMLSVVLDRAIHLYVRSGGTPAGSPRSREPIPRASLGINTLPHVNPV